MNLSLYLQAPSHGLGRFRQHEPPPRCLHGLCRSRGPNIFPRSNVKCNSRRFCNWQVVIQNSGLRRNQFIKNEVLRLIWEFYLLDFLRLGVEVGAGAAASSNYCSPCDIVQALSSQQSTLKDNQANCVPAWLSTLLILALFKPILPDYSRNKPHLALIISYSLWTLQ